MNREHLIGVICLLLGAVTYGLAQQMPAGVGAIGVSGPGFFPKILAIVLGISGVAEITIGFTQRQSMPTLSIVQLVRQLKRREVVNVFLILGMLVVYELVFEALGFILTTFVFLSIVMLRLGVPFLRSVIYSVGFVVVIYLLFTVLFSIPLPSGILPVLEF